MRRKQQIQRLGDLRLYPSYFHTSYLQLTKIREALSRVIHVHLPPGDGLRILDLGCGYRPYEPLFTKAGFVYHGAELEGISRNELQILPSGKVNCADASYDAILSTQVLEHVEDPAAYLREAWRILKPGGHIVITTHGYFYNHPCPVDYWRWTIEGLTYALKREHFHTTHAEGLVGMMPTAIFLFRKASLERIPRFLGLRRAYSFLLQQCMMFTEYCHTDKERMQDSMIILLVAQKSDTAVMV